MMTSYYFYIFYDSQKYWIESSSFLISLSSTTWFLRRSWLLWLHFNCTWRQENSFLLVLFESSLCYNFKCITNHKIFFCWCLEEWHLVMLFSPSVSFTFTNLFINYFSISSAFSNNVFLPFFHQIYLPY